jgi:hypothetical protein
MVATAAAAVPNINALINNISTLTKVLAREADALVKAGSLIFCLLEPREVAAESST